MGSKSSEPMKPPMTKEQKIALKRLYRRNSDGAKHFKEFAARAEYSPIMDCLMIQWCKMHVGIEPDGYTHT